MKELTKLRKNIDKIDLKLVKTLSKREKITNKIKEIKNQNKIKTKDKAREKAIIKRLKTLKLIKNKLLEDVYNVIFKQIK